MTRRPPARRALIVTTLLAILGVLAGCASAPPADTAGISTVPAPTVIAEAPAPAPAVPESPATSSPEAATPPPATAAAAAPAVPDPDAGRPAAVIVPDADLEPSRPPLPRQRLDPEQDRVRLDLWQRIRDGERMPDIDNELVRKWEQWYTSRPDYIERMTERGARYLFHIVEEIERRGLPMDLALLPFIESAFNPQAMSRARASGMWQFMPATGRDFKLTQNLFRDDRRDVLASTRAALDYLERLHGLFGDWHLALAAYNWGQGNVSRAIERNRRAGLPTDYQSLQRLPQETREYVPKLQAVKNIVMRPGDFGVALAPLENHPYFLTVQIERDIDVALAARLAGMTPEHFEQLNPQHNKPVILAAGTPHVLLPYDNANRFIRELAEHRGPLASWTAFVVPRTLKPADAAQLVGMNEATLRELNRIPPRMLVRAGSTLLVPRHGRAADVAEQIAENAAISLAPEARARRGGKAARVVRATPNRKGAAVARAPAAPTASARRVATKAAQPPRRAAASKSAQAKAPSVKAAAARPQPSGAGRAQPPKR